MIILGCVLCTTMLAIGIGLLATSKGDAIAIILGMVSSIFGGAWGLVFLAMLMGW